MERIIDSHMENLCCINVQDIHIDDDSDGSTNATMPPPGASLICKDRQLTLEYCLRNMCSEIWARNAEARLSSACSAPCTGVSAVLQITQYG